MGQYVGVAGSGPSAAFFDLDRTLIAGSSAFALAIAGAQDEDDADPRAPARRGHGGRRSSSAATTTGATDNARDRVLGFIRGQRQDDLATLNERVLPTLLGKIRPEARRLLDMHRHAGRATYIVSAAPQEIVEPLAASLGMTGAIGTRGEVVDGVYTGELDGPFCYGPGKVEAILRARALGGLDLAQCYAYSDSASDLPMLSAVGHPVAVNPDGKLERHARGNGWPVVVFSRAHQDGHPAHRRRGGLDRDRRPATFVAGARARHADGRAVRPRRWFRRRVRDERQLARDWATSAPRRIPHLAVLLEQPVLDEPAPEPASQRAGRGHATHVDGQLERRRPRHRHLGRLKHTGANASATWSSPTASIGWSAGERRRT